MACIKKKAARRRDPFARPRGKRNKKELHHSILKEGTALCVVLAIGFTFLCLLAGTALLQGGWNESVLSRFSTQTTEEASISAKPLPVPTGFHLLTRTRTASSNRAIFTQTTEEASISAKPLPVPTGFHLLTRTRTALSNRAIFTQTTEEALISGKPLPTLINTQVHTRTWNDSSDRIVFAQKTKEASTSGKLLPIPTKVHIRTTTQDLVESELRCDYQPSLCGAGPEKEKYSDIKPTEVCVSIGSNTKDARLECDKINPEHRCPAIEKRPGEEPEDVDKVSSIPGELSQSTVNSWSNSEELVGGFWHDCVASAPWVILSIVIVLNFPLARILKSQAMKAKNAIVIVHNFPLARILKSQAMKAKKAFRDASTHIRLAPTKVRSDHSSMQYPGVVEPSQKEMLKAVLQNANVANNLEEHGDTLGAVNAYREVRSLLQEIQVRGLSAEERLDWAALYDTCEARIVELLNAFIMHRSNKEPLDIVTYLLAVLSISIFATFLLKFIMSLRPGLMDTDLGIENGPYTLDTVFGERAWRGTRSNSQLKQLAKQYSLIVSDSFLAGGLYMDNSNSHDFTWLTKPKWEAPTSESDLDWEVIPRGSYLDPPIASFRAGKSTSTYESGLWIGKRTDDAVISSLMMDHSKGSVNHRSWSGCDKLLSDSSEQDFKFRNRDIVAFALQYILPAGIFACAIPRTSSKTAAFNIFPARSRLSRYMEPPLAKGKKRVRWICKCGRTLYDDFQEIRPGVAAELELELNARFSVNRRYVNRDGSGSQSSQGGDRQTLKRGNRRSRWFPWKSNSNKLPSLPLQQPEHTADQDTEAGNTSWPSEKIFLLLCIPHLRWAAKLVHMDVRALHSDQILFAELRSRYCSMRGRWTWLSLKQLTRIQFVQFELHKNELVDIRKTNDLPPENRDDYRYCPIPAEVIPPVGENILMHLYDHPEDADDDAFCLDRVPKKLRERLTCSQRIGWGVNFSEGLNVKKICIFGLLGLFLSAAFGVAWSIKRDDVQGGFGVAAFVLAAMTFITGILQATLETK